uniref:Alpha-mann_mid domain-containing protein n=1 Tax=Heterorhabditis bacteriophora TaxID=37862 RepID=A0A1I7X6F2_HETBA
MCCGGSLGWILQHSAFFQKTRTIHSCKKFKHKKRKKSWYCLYTKYFNIWYSQYLIRAADLLSAQVQRTVKNSKSVNMSTKLEAARRSLSLFQHHDAITGTSKRHVMDNYSQLLHNATLLSKEVIEDSMASLVEEKVHLIEYPQIYTETSTKIPLSVKDGRTVSIQVYNSLPYNINDVIALRVDTVDITVFENGKEIEAQIEPYIHLGDIAQKTFLITFRSSLSPLSTSIFRLKSINKSGHTQIAEIRAPISAIKEMKKALPAFFAVTEIMEDDFRINTYNIKTKHDSSTGLLTHMDTIHSGSHEMNVSFSAYLKASGAAYVMRVPGQTKDRFSRVFICLWISCIKNSQQKILMGLAVRFATRENARAKSVTSARSKYTKLLRRERHSSLPIPGNFYPMPTAAVIENTQTRLTVVSNVEHGVSPIDGGMEIIIERMYRSLNFFKNYIKFNFIACLSFYFAYTCCSSSSSEHFISTCYYCRCSGKRLLILYRNGVVCYSKSPVSCSGDVEVMSRT